MNLIGKYKKILIPTLIIVFVLSIGAIAISKNFVAEKGASKKSDSEIISKAKDKVKEQTDDTSAAVLAKVYGKSKEQVLALKEELGDWSLVGKRLMTDEHLLSEEEIIELYDQGYGLKDIEKAQQYAISSDIPVDTILKAKGKTLKDGEGKSWGEVTKELKIDTRSATEKLGLDQADVDKMKKQGLSEKVILEIGLLAKNYEVDYKDILSEYRKGKSLTELKKEHISKKEAKKDKAKQQKDIKARSIELEEKMAKDKFKITDEQIEMCKKHGIHGAETISVKVLADRYKLSFDKVLELKVKHRDWDKVVNKLGGKA